MTTAATAYATARAALQAELADLQRHAATLVDDPARVDWATVGSLQATVATLHELTDRVHGRGEYARSL